MENGLWTVQFQGPQGSGGGVVVLTSGHVLGGDSGFTYIGTYELRENAFKAKVSVTNFDPAIQSVLGIRGNYDLILEGTMRGDSIVGTGALATQPQAKINLILTKKSSLT